MLPGMSTPQRFADKVVLVTGAASGIGRCTALRVAEEGGTVACLDMAVDGAEKTAAEIGGKGKAYACNVADETSVSAAVAAVVADFGRLDVVCNIAGIGNFAHTLEVTKDAWDKIIAVNLTGTFLVCQAAIPHLLETGGNIVNTASTAGKIGQPYSAAYCASKGGVRLLTQALAWEFIDRGIRFNAVAPGGVQTPLIQSFGFPEGANAKLFDRLTSPMGWCQPEEVAGLFAYLGSDEARYITGALFTIDGGMTC
jgi:NAD(P)-dependent dehydrogenase (short-subunit alcohol dehydrogenase family)